eukprot:CAMPEP_0172733772 /NCGR_PEP_ID=MMETSP1074-20121228/108051_1 /TAXON_ID=2916 /ORGANISM="Ceratium fusus, Strain PA161109" /LENGTH=75 /DNA_ID=CAMNT_0013562399 /DNA_START=189 /DNA_END=412 /DNA_ORIENTATION=+
MTHFMQLNSRKARMPVIMMATTFAVQSLKLLRVHEASLYQYIDQANWKRTPLINRNAPRLAKICGRGQKSAIEHL